MGAIEKEEEEDIDRTDRTIDKSTDRKEDLEHQTEIIMEITKVTVQGEATNHESIIEGTKTDENRNPSGQTDMNKITETDRITMDTTDIDNRQATTPIKIDTRKFPVKLILSTKNRSKKIKIL